MKYHDEEYFGLGRDDQVALLNSDTETESGHYWTTGERVG
jgi:hypothetical protein